MSNRYENIKKLVNRSINHEMYLQRVLKSTLCAFDDKRCYIKKYSNFSLEMNFDKNSTSQLSDILFLANTSELSWQNSASIYSIFSSLNKRRFLHIALILFARQSLGDVLCSAPQTLRRSLNFSRCHFCIYQSALGDRIETEKLEYILDVYCQHIYTKCTVSKAGIYILYNVDIGSSYNFLQSRLQCKSTRANVFSRLC